MRILSEGIGEVSSENAKNRLPLEMSVAEAIEGVEAVRVSGPANTRTSSVACDSRRAERGCLFFALPGEKMDGIRFVGDAVERGAVAIASSHARQADISREVAWVELTQIGRAHV